MKTDTQRCTWHLNNGCPCPYKAKYGTFCGYHKRHYIPEKVLSLNQQIEALPDNCIEMIYKHVYDFNFSKVINELKKECDEYWEFMNQEMYLDDEYMEAHRLLPMPEPPLINGVPNYLCDEFCEAMDTYLNTLDDKVCIENWLTETYCLECYHEVHIWLLGHRPCEYAWL